MLPGFIKVLEKPEYLEALGVTAEDVKLVKESFATEEINIDEVVAEINKVLKINRLDEISVISKDDYISYGEGTIDLAITVEDETLGIKLSIIQSKSNVNEQFDFLIGTPSNENVMKFRRTTKIRRRSISELIATY